MVSDMLFVTRSNSLDSTQENWCFVLRGVQLGQSVLDVACRTIRFSTNDCRRRAWTGASHFIIEFSLTRANLNKNFLWYYVVYFVYLFVSHYVRHVENLSWVWSMCILHDESAGNVSKTRCARKARCFRELVELTSSSVECVHVQFFLHTWWCQRAL